MMTVAKAELTEEEEEEEINVEEEEEEEVEEGGRLAEDLRTGCSNSSLPQTSDNFGLAASQRRKQRR